MIIQSSQIKMNAEHEKSEIVQVNRRFDATTGDSSFMMLLDEAAGSLRQVDRSIPSAENADSILVMTEEGYQFRTEEKEQKAVLQQKVTHAQLLHSLMEAMSGRAIPTLSSSSQESGAEFASAGTENKAASSPERISLRPLRMEMNFTLTESIDEYECSSFSSCGQVKTADGREIEFGLEMTMERSYSETRTVEVTQEVVFTDPLILNFSGSATELTDEKYAFDLNADGDMEMISYLRGNNGMLALDKNGDGIVSDGSELFGVLSGNGFNDLVEYDEDGNHYIDEADSIFSDLLVWSKTQTEDRLALLETHDVGAIYLGSIETPFDLKGNDNEQHGRVRSSGVYLTEAGAVGALQQVDMTV